MNRLPGSEANKSLKWGLRDLDIGENDRDVRGASANVSSTNRNDIFTNPRRETRNRDTFGERGPKDLLHPSTRRGSAIGLRGGIHTNASRLNVGGDTGFSYRGENSRGRGTKCDRGEERGGRGFRGDGRGRGGDGRGRGGDGSGRGGVMRGHGGDRRGPEARGYFPNGRRNSTGEDKNSDQVRGSSRFIIGYTILKSWSEIEDHEELLIQMTNNMDPLEEVLNSDMKEDWYSLVTKSFDSVILCQHHTQKLKKILKVITDSHFLTQNLFKFLDEKSERGKYWRDANEFFNSILRIVQQIVKYLPDCAQKCKIPLSFLQSFIPKLEALSSKDELETSISTILTSVTEAKKNWNERLTRKGLRLPTVDGDSPPDDFRELSVIPTVEDLFPDEDEELFLRAVITKGAYRDQNHYLDIQFRLMREDFIKPLRNGIREFREHGHGKQFKSSDIRIYKDVHFTGMIHINGINHVVQFDDQDLKHVKWDHSKRLMNGNLVCLSNDNFESTLIFATISYRNVDMLKNGIVNIICHFGLDIALKTSPSDTFIMAETMAYYEAVNPILHGLQAIESDLPLKKYIISCEKMLRPPSYLLNGIRKYDIGCLMKTPRPTDVSVLNTLSWPSAENMCLNPSQRDAAIQALTKEISVIQGPPGTGKTYVGLKVMQVLLENQDQMIENDISNHDPILVVCYTNHALDQFLEGILQFCDNGIVRVGGKKSSDLLDRFNLVNLKKKLKTESKAWKYSLYDLRNSLNDVSEEIEEKKIQIDSLANYILSEDILVNCISPKHYADLLSGPMDGKVKSKICQWLNASNKTFENALPNMIKYHMRKLVVNCLKLPVEKEKKTCKNFRSASIVDRVKLYVVWLRRHQRALKSVLDDQHPNPSTDKQYMSYLYHQSARLSILKDNEICRIIPRQDFQDILDCLGRASQTFQQEDCVVEAWVLGLHNEYSTQLDDVEMLDDFIHKSLSEEEGDNFDDKEESENVKRHRQVFEDDGDDGDEMKNLKAMSKVRNEWTFLINRTRLLGIREDVINESGEGKNVPQDEDGFTKVTHQKHLTFSQVQKYLSDDGLPPLKEDEEDLIDDLWSLDLRKRFSLYRLWITRYKDVLVTEIEEKVGAYNDIKRELDETRMKEDIDVLRKAKVIGMTTTGAAKKRALLEVVGCRIIVVEEAAEVLEAHIVTALNKNCKHLILIGDHKQLRPNPTVYEHAKFYGLDVSLFERLVNNDIPHVTLREQHRMRESISVMMRHIYSDLQDHMSVKKYENIRGVSKNIFFIQHEQKEESMKDTLSKTNPFEAEYLIRLCRYFLLQGYKPSQITILATYAGQVLALKKEMNKQQVQHWVRVTAVDNFQGEENDIILLSLVRSNDNSNVGFLKVDNRVCVALSRAKKGMFAIGNIKLLASQSKLWGKILQTAEDEETTGDGLPLACCNHPDKKNIIRNPQDFDNCPEGGCNEKCDFRLDCGHTCHLKCHGYNLEHKDFRCLASCKKTCSEGHPCKWRCWQDCGNCKEMVSRTISACGHTNVFDCCIKPKDTDCYSQCETDLPCGHRCQGKCGECKKYGKHKLCRVPVSYFWPCDHTVEVQCHFKPSENPCPKICGEVLNCGHKCNGKCSDCLNAAVHHACKEKCQNILVCGHKCQSLCSIPCPPCSRPCPVMCRHGPCNNKHKQRTCGESCIPCQEKCLNFCSHKKCDHKCFEKCTAEQCQKQCHKNVISCGHTCSGLCGEVCVCTKCSKVSECKTSKDKDQPQTKGNNLILKIPSCGHVFYVDEVDEYVMAMNKEDTSDFICCPVCSTPIQKCSRYENISRERTQRREEEKKKLLEAHQMSLSQEQMLRESLRLVRDKDTDMIWFDWRHLDDEKLKNAGEIQAVSSKIKFAYVLTQIQALEQKDTFSTKGTDDIKDRISALLKIKKHMTPQQIEEFKLDLKRLLICRYFDVLKNMADTLSLKIDESSIKRWIDVVDALRGPKPPGHSVEDGVVVVHALEDGIANLSSNTSVQAMILLKKKMVKGAIKVLDADDKKMLSDILDYHPRRSAPVRTKNTASQKKSALLKFLINSDKDECDSSTNGDEKTLLPKRKVPFLNF